MVNFNEHLETPTLCRRIGKRFRKVTSPYKVLSIPKSFSKSEYNTEERIWKLLTVTRYCTYYISNDGLVLSIDRRNNTPEWEILKKSFKNGRNSVTIGFSTYYVYRLVAMAFVINPNPKTRIEVHHINGDKLDDRAENLIWLTKRQHQRIHAKMKKEAEKNKKQCA